jgi:hypothetical protein
MTEPTRSGGSSSLKRYGPIAVVVVLVVGAIALFGQSGDDDDDGGGGGGTGSSETPEGLPAIFQEAEDEDIDWGEQCDTELGRLKVPLNNAAPCIEPFEEGADNGGATAPGVTADAIKVVVYQGQPDPLQQAVAGDAGADVDPEDTSAVAVQYLEMFEDVYETYGRTLDIEVFEATGGPADATAAQADARSIIDMEPFAVIGGPAQTPAFWQELVDAEILCFGTCVQSEGWDVVEDNAPYLWPTGPSPEQADLHLAELVGKQLVGKPAEFAGDPDLQDQERVFGWIQAETETGEYAARNDEFDRVLEEEYGGEVVARSTYIFDLAAAQETATTVVARMRDAGVTSVILSTDPFVPGAITEEATEQEYFPEWIIGPSVLVDTTFFGRTYDQEQWEHALGLGLPSARADNSLSDAFFVYDWYFGEESPINTVNVVMGPIERFMLGVHLAGPELTPDNFEAGMFRYPPPEQRGKTFAHQSWGEEIWGRSDHNSSDDATAIFWDPDATGEDEAGNEGVGMLRYVDGGTRFLPGEWPEEEMAFFDEESSVTIYEELPEGEAPPDYEPWPGSPAAG